MPVVFDCVIYQWKSESRLLIDIINKGLKTKFLKGGMDIKIAAWFIIELVDKMFNLKTNYSAYNYPKNSVYKEALDKWWTEDLNLLDEIIWHSEIPNAIKRIPLLAF
jgi:hypothetical protein